LKKKKKQPEHKQTNPKLLYLEISEPRCFLDVDVKKYLKKTLTSLCRATLPRSAAVFILFTERKILKLNGKARFLQDFDSRNFYIWKLKISVSWR